METIFDFQPTLKELASTGIDSISLLLAHGIHISDPVKEDVYKQLVTQDDAYFDLAVLFECRNNQKKANEFWKKIPARHQEYLLGFDDVAIVK